MSRTFKITIEYDGAAYVGWQRQTNGYGVQQAIEEAIHAFSGEDLRVIAAGRTDAGVHALGQVGSFTLEKDMDARRVLTALNAHLRKEAIAIVACEEVDAGFSARFDATARHYRYRIINRRTPLAIDRGHAWRVVQSLDADAMHAAAQHLIGEHDFTTFRHVACQAKSPIKTLNRLDVSRHGEEIICYASAQSFLHSQVRSMVGTLKLVGEGKWSGADLKAALDAADRHRLGFNAPPEGLYLLRVDY